MICTARAALSALCLTVLLTGCTDSSTDPGVITGTLTVAATTGGDDIDADGYVVSLGSTEQAVAANGSVTFPDLSAGVVSVTLGGIAGNCSVSGSNPASATIVAGQTTTLTFALTCEAAPEPTTLVAADRVGNIYSVNALTGVESLLFTPETDDGLGGTEPLGVISSMAWIPGTDAWWLGLGGNSVCGTNGCVYVEDTDAASSTFGQWVELVETGLRAIAGLAVDPESGRIFTFEADASGELYEMDPVTGDTSTVLSGLSEGSSGKGTTFGPDGRLYVFGGSRLTAIDVDTGEVETVGDFTLTGFPTLVDSSPTIGSMTTRETDGVVFAVLKDGGGGGRTTTTYLVTVDLATAEVTNVGATTELLDGLAFIPTRLVEGR